MKRIGLFCIFLGLQVSAEWIEPPLRSNKGYLVPSPDYQPIFPNDHGAHREYALEWWYWVGHLKTVGSDRGFGFQSTVFRVAGDPEGAEGMDDSLFGNRQLFLAHSALSDLENRDYLHTERVSREGWQARASSETLSLKVGGIEAGILKEKVGHYLVTHYPNKGKLELELIPQKPLIRFGDRGLSRKGDDPSSVSWYWTYSRLKAKGTLVYQGKKFEVTGEAWMDHEISSSQLGEGLVGWDWTCMQLFDGTEIKAYRLRKKDGTPDRWSSVYWIDSKGRVEKVQADHFSWEEQSNWISPGSGLSYPIRVKISAKHPKHGMREYRLEPFIENQEFVGNRGDNPYWEGACSVLNTNGEEIGRAYLELAGYGGGLGARLN